MAAHGLTILKQILRHIEERPQVACEIAYAATAAPGTDIGTGFSYETWRALDAAASSADVTGLRAVVEQGIKDHAWMEGFRTLEEVREAIRALREQSAC